MNSLAEWDVNKLGWFKLKDGRPDFNKALVKQAFRGQVCKKIFRTKFKYYQLISLLLTNKYNSVMIHLKLNV